MQDKKKLIQVKEPYRKYEENQKLIYDTIQDLTTPASPIPSFVEISKHCGLSVSSITEHFKNLDFEYVRNKAKIHTPAIIDAIAKGAMEGRSNSQKLYMQIVEKIFLNGEKKPEVPKDDAGKMDINKSVEGEVNVNIVRHIVFHKNDLKKIDQLNKTGTHPPDAITIEDEKGNKMLPPPVKNIEIAEVEKKSAGLDEIQIKDNINSAEDVLKGTDFFKDIGIK